MIFGIGVDLVEIERVHQVFSRYGERFLQRVLCAEEIEDFRRSSKPARFLASAFAAKEALSKAVGTGIRHPVTWRAINVRRDDLGKPILKMEEQLQRWMDERGIGASHLSLTDERGMACAMVVVERQ
jgi:holo-[acyl-carrier protein] synthase